MSAFQPSVCVCVVTKQAQMHLLCAQGRIWPLCYSLCILPDEVVLSEDEQGAVDGEAVLFDGVRVVNGHCPGSLGHRLLVNPLAPRSATATPGSPSAAAARCASSPAAAAACASSIAGGQILREASHPGNAQIQKGKSKVVSVEVEGRRITTNTLHPKHTACESAQKALRLEEQK